MSICFYSSAVGQQIVIAMFGVVLAGCFSDFDVDGGYGVLDGSTAQSATATSGQGGGSGLGVGGNQGTSGGSEDGQGGAGGIGGGACAFNFSAEIPPMVIYTIENADRCYAIVDMKKTWFGAKNICAGSTMYLSSITSIDELNLINGEISKNVNTDKHSFWIGGTDMDSAGGADSEGQFTWCNGEMWDAMSSSLWGSGEPNNDNNNEDCVLLLWDTKKFNDENCWNTRRFICESKK